MDGIVIFLQYLHKDILHLDQIKAAVHMGKDIQVQEIFLHLRHQQIPVKPAFAGLIPFQGDTFLVPNQF